MAAPIKRGCGFRMAGGAYIVTKLSPFGTKTVEDFIVEPRKPLDPEQMGLAAIGVMPFKIRPEDEQTHLMNWVGEENYPNPTDFIEEVRRHGASTRISANFRFDLIKGNPYIYHVHAHAWIDNHLEYVLDPPAELRKQEQAGRSWLDRVTSGITGDFESGRRPCPKHKHEFEDLEFCAARWWEDVHGGSYVVGTPGDREVERTIGDTTYRGYVPPKGVTPVYFPAVFFRLPIHGIEVIKDPAKNKHEEVLEKAFYAEVDVKVVDF